MSTSKQHQLAMRFPQDVGPQAHVLFEHALLESWINNLMPSLTTPDLNNLQVLDAIQDYLFSADSEESETLEKMLNEELYGCLYGLKTVLLTFDNNWQHTMRCLDEHQKLAPVC